MDERHSSLSFRAERGISQSKLGTHNLICVINELGGILRSAQDDNQTELPHAQRSLT